MYLVTLYFVAKPTGIEPSHPHFGLQNQPLDVEEIS